MNWNNGLKMRWIENNWNNVCFVFKARYFSEQDIDEFRDCFYLITVHSNGRITSIDELKTIMRSLGMSPTLPELKQYYQHKGLSHICLIYVSNLTNTSNPMKTFDDLNQHFIHLSQLLIYWFIWYLGKGGKLSFADFLDVMHSHSVKEKVSQEVMDAFRASDWNRSGTISVGDLKHYLIGCGESVDRKELEALFRETNTNGSNNSLIKYEDFVRIICSPIPDYWLFGQLFWIWFWFQTLI